MQPRRLCHCRHCALPCRVSAAKLCEVRYSAGRSACHVRARRAHGLGVALPARWISLPLACFFAPFPTSFWRRSNRASVAHARRSHVQHSHNCLNDRGHWLAAVVALSALRTCRAFTGGFSIQQKPLSNLCVADQFFGLTPPHGCERCVAMQSTCQSP